MTLAAFQRAVAELVADGKSATPPLDLDEAEQARLAGLAGTRGVTTMRMLYMSWRLTKVLSLLPMTMKALGDDRAAEMLHDFWRLRRATSLHFVEECLDFAAFLHQRLAADGTSPPGYLADVLAFEAARLKLRYRQSLGLPPGMERIRLATEPSALFASLTEGSDPALLPCGEFVLRGTLDGDGSESWVVEGGGTLEMQPPALAADTAF